MIDSNTFFQDSRRNDALCHAPAASPRGDPWLRNVEFGSMLTTGAQRRYLPSAASSPNAGVRRASGPPAVEYRNIFYGPGDDGVVSGEFALWSLGQRGEARGRTRRLRFSAPRIAASASHRSPPRKAAADTGSGGGPVSSLGSRAARRRAQLRDLRDTALAEMAKPEARPALRPTRRRYRRVKNRETGKTGKQCCRSVRRGAADNAGSLWCRTLHWLGSRDILPASPEVRQNSAPSCILDLPSGPH
jgi:hypothetical protein